MRSNSNIERIKILADEISKKESQEVEFKQEAVFCLNKLKDLLYAPRVNKKAALDEIEKLIAKLKN